MFSAAWAAPAQGVTSGLAAPVATADAAKAPAKASPLVNPFNGKQLSAEQIQHELEMTRMQTQLLEEQLKQTNLSEELKNVPLRKAVEAAQSKTAVQKEEVTQREMGLTAKAAVAPKKVVVPVKKSLRTAKAKKSDGNATSDAKPVAEAAAPRPTLSSVISVGGKKSAVLEFAGGVMAVSEGDNTPFGPMHVVDNQTVQVGGQTLKVHQATLGRFVSSDPKPVKPGPSGAAPAVTAAPVATGAQNAILPPPLPTSVPPIPAPAANANLNPANSLKLPVGVTALPSSAR